MKSATEQLKATAWQNDGILNPFYSKFSGGSKGPVFYWGGRFWGRSFDFQQNGRGSIIIEGCGPLIITYPYRLGGRPFRTLKAHFAVSKHKMVRLLVCQLISAAGFSVEQRNFTGCKIECSHATVLVVKICDHITINKGLQTDMFQKENSFQEGETALLATSNFITIKNSFSVTLRPQKCIKSHLWQSTISQFSDEACSRTP